MAAAGVLVGATAGSLGERGHVAAAADRGSRCGQLPPLPNARPAAVTGGEPAQFAAFRQSQLPADAAGNAALGLGHELGDQLVSFDPALTRRVHAPAVKQLFRPARAYIFVGVGSAEEFTLEKLLPCARKYSPARRRRAQRVLNLLRLFRPAGLSYCFAETYQPRKRPAGAFMSALCDTFQNAGSGYGMNEIIGGHRAPSLAGLVPDGVAAVALHYRHGVIHAVVTENVFWTRVPRLPPIQSAVGTSPPARVLRRQVLDALPRRIDWLAPDGHSIRSFTPPSGYVRLLVQRDQACIQLDCGR
jgi:hypothetical protein